MSILSDIFSGGAKNLVDSVGNVLDNVITTKEEKQQLDNEMLKAEMQYNLEGRKLDLEEKKISVEDTGNARAREIQVNESDKTTKLNRNLMPFLALGTIILNFALFFVLIFNPSLIKAEGKEILFYILGVCSTVLVQVYNYYFGSSAGSASKDFTIRTLKGNS